jgi:hypothetical protein
MAGSHSGNEGRHEDKVMFSNISMNVETGQWVLTDEYGDTYELRPTGLPRDPMRVIPLTWGARRQTRHQEQKQVQQV